VNLVKRSPAVAEAMAGKKGQRGTNVVLHFFFLTL